MNKDRMEGKVKDAAGRIERQAGEWTGDKKMQAEGTLKQVEGKVQNAVGKVKDAVKSAQDEDRERKNARQNNEEETAEVEVIPRTPRR